ncbi:hypothetical protein PENSPDRAFT_73133 [Peniophora sp. CONT]|nr:hypothetical protein PENSPDRAFT_73133 [Peniophora sp. CONT]
MYLPHGKGSGFPFVEFDISQSGASAGAPVLCAWPLSGQYGVGSRYLYYALVLVSIFFLKTDWMRGAATAAALIYAAVAALHSIILAVYSQKHAIDMDIFGAFQILAIGVLSAPITVRYSRVYFQTDGRNIIFLWTLLMIAGLLSLVACFARATEQTCVDTNGVNVTIAQFTANMSSGDPNLCALQCGSAFSPIRQDPQNPAQYILVPHKGMTLDTATLLCAACCIPALLSLIVMWQKVVRTNWQLLYGHTPAEDTPAGVALPSPMSPETGSAREIRLRRDEKKMDAIIKRGLNLVERIVYCVCILTIVVLGEENFWSPETRLGVEPMSSVGQWGPIVGAVFAALGSAYTSWLSPQLPDSAQADMPPARDGAIRLTESPRQISEPLPPDTSTRPPLTRDRSRRRSSTLREEMLHHRKQFARGLDRVAAWTTPASDRFLDDITQTAGHDRFRDYPRIPGEEERNSHLAEDEERHRLMTSGRSRSAQSLVTVISGASASSHDSQEPRAVAMRQTSEGGTNSGLLTLPSWQLRSASRTPPMLFSPAAEQSDSIEDDDAIVMVNRTSSSTSSLSSSPPIIVVTPDESA